MIKKLKLIFYITSAVVLGLVTIWEIYSIRQSLVAANGKQLDAEVNQVKDVVDLWKKRQPFDSDAIEKSATPSSLRVTPTITIELEDTPATNSAEN